jgi:alpha-ribazole phosphatase
VAKLILARHGETTWNSSLRYQGQQDIPLSAVGRRQAEALAQRLARVPIAAAYASDLSRAAETAAIICRGRDLAVTRLPALREAHFGAWEGLTYAEAAARWPEIARQRKLDPAGTRVPGGETLAEVQARAQAAVQAIERAHPPDATLLIVAHGGVLRALVCGFLGLDLRAAWRLRLDNCGLTIVETYPEGAILMTLNDVSHLEELPHDGAVAATET